MKKRNFIRVCGNDIEIIYSDPQAWAHGAMGRSDVLKGEILIRHDLEADQAASTTIHEVIHLILDGIGQYQASQDEVFVSSFAAAWTAFLRDNPNRLAAWREVWEITP